ncbi:GIN domain-containing protein [Flavobacterium lindanitolerans]|uniref:Autotransporter adhesin-like protein n=1 Tax=Flavobacterium lindanitolerans TaxID=428988 RepID=A0A497UUF7_9FLAO|nr:DUF2807 domain-containing protein [Flavobacterium lindanitolerans]MBC8645262.1 DUF2807 domain-containing protein [Flavobacterium lindanitolerans]PKW29738.1 putative autotransporter adhesin-like protein [Flavobacterium lindanitolerans]RLJ34761.1 putative autotransporter adhesin-like protein [Flavobacterium lindanitolerans]
MLKFIITTAMAMAALTGYAQVSENRKVNDFSKIEVESGIELFYMESDENSIRVEGDSKDGLDSIITETDGKTLRIYHVKRNKKQNESISKVFVAAKNVNSFKASSKSKLFFENPVTSDDIKIEILSDSYFRGTVLPNSRVSVKVSSGSLFSGRFETDSFTGMFKSGATVSLTGKAKKATINTSSGAYCNAKNFFVDKMTATADTKSSALLNAREKIAKATDASSITFFGNPENLKTGYDSFAIVNKSGAITWNTPE